MGVVSEEVKAAVGKKRGPDVSGAKVLRKLIQEADDDKRSGE